MTRIGITGHSNLTASTADLVRGSIREIVQAYRTDGVTGLSCLARGSDQIFAEAILDLGGRLEVVIPSADYGKIPDPTARARYERLLGQAEPVHNLDFANAGRDAYYAASVYLIDHCDLLLAVWDGSPPDGMGGTADAVAYARKCGSNVLVIWPDGAERS